MLWAEAGGMEAGGSPAGPRRPQQGFWIMILSAVRSQLEAWHDLICVFKDYFQATVWRMDWESKETKATSEEVAGVLVRSGIDLKEGGERGGSQATALGEICRTC